MTFSRANYNVENNVVCPLRLQCIQVCLPTHKYYNLQFNFFSKISCLNLLFKISSYIFGQTKWIVLKSSLDFDLSKSSWPWVTSKNGLQSTFLMSSFSIPMSRRCGFDRALASLLMKVIFQYEWNTDAMTSSKHKAQGALYTSLSINKQAWSNSLKVTWSENFYCFFRKESGTQNSINKDWQDKSYLQVYDISLCNVRRKFVYTEPYFKDAKGIL